MKIKIPLKNTFYDEDDKKTRFKEAVYETTKEHLPIILKLIDIIIKNKLIYQDNITIETKEFNNININNINEQEEYSKRVNLYNENIDYGYLYRANFTTIITTEEKVKIILDFIHFLYIELLYYSMINNEIVDYKKEHGMPKEWIKL